MKANSATMRPILDRPILDRSMTDRATPPISGRYGFTLLEVMVSVAIVAIAFSAVYKLYSQAFAMNQSVNFYTTASLLAQSKLAEVSTQSPRDLMDGAGNFEDEFADFNWQITVRTVEAEELSTSQQALREIDIVITNEQQGGSFTLRTYRFDNDV